MVDRDEILPLQHDYARKIDTRDAKGFASLFSEDGMMIPPEMAEIAVKQVAITGKERLATIIRDLPAGGAHYPRDETIEIDGDHASATCSYRSTMADGLHLSGVYHDRYLRTPDGWRIAYREIIPNEA